MKKKKKSVFLFKQPVQASLNFLVGSIILGLTCFIIFVSAAPPASPYAPGATLTPDCAPGDPNCTVYAPLATSLTADTAVTMSDYALNFDSGTLYVDALNNRVGIGTTSPYAKLAVAGQIVAEYFTATSTSATSTFASQLLLSRIPDTPHTFASWATGAANSQVQNSSFYINPASAIGDTNLFGAAVSDSVKFLIDAEGDVFANSITLAGGSSLSTTTISTLTVENSANLGDAPNADSHIIKGIVNLYATSSSPALSIWNSSSGDILQLLGGAATPQNYLTLTSAGNLGLGTTTPYAKLAVVGRGVFDQDVRADYFTATSTTASSTLPWLVATRSDLGTVIKGTWNGASIADGYIDNNITINGGAISGATNTMSLGSDSTGDIYYRDSSGYLARLAIGTGGYVLGSVSGIPGWVATTTLSTISGTLANTQGGTGQDSSAWNGPISAANGVWSATTSIGVQYGGTGLTSAMAGYALIGNTATALSATSSLFISTAGNVGIGTTTPNSLLNIASTLPRFYLSDTDFATNGHWFMENDAGVFSLGTTSSALAVSATRALSITNAGNVGIGTTGPLVALHLYSAQDVPLRIETTGTAAPGFDLWFGGLRKGTFGIAQTADQFVTGAASNDFVFRPDGSGNFIFANSAANTQLFKIMNTGNVGIGDTSPNSLLEIASTTADTAITITSGAGSWIMGMDYSDGGKFKIASSSALGTNDRLTITTDGNIGIGTTGPGAKLHVEDLTADTELIVSAGDNPGVYKSPTITLMDKDGNDVQQAKYGLKLDAANNRFDILYGTTGAYTDTRLSITTTGNVGIGTTTPNSLLNIASTLPRFYLSDTDFATNGHWFMENDAGVFSLGTTSSALAVSATRALSITNAGNVGIGTTGPLFPLHLMVSDVSPNPDLSGTTVLLEKNDNFILNILTPATKQGAIYFSDINNNGMGQIGYDHSADALIFRANAVEKMRILGGTGNVGIGTTSPGALFSVQGNGLFSGNLQVSGINATSTLTVQSTSATSTFSTGGLTVGTSQFVVQQTSGNVGIGTTTPNALLNIASTLPRFYLSDTDFATNGHWFMENDAGVFSLGTTSSALAVSGTRALSITNAGNVGIGTTVPARKLTISGANNTFPLAVAKDSSNVRFAVDVDNNGGAINQWTVGGVLTTYITSNGSSYFNAGNVGIGTTNPGSILALGGTAARIFGMDRNTTAATAGQGFTISSGGAIAGTADLAGGDLTLKSGISTGTGTSALHFYTATAGVTGTADNAPTEKLTILGSGNVGIGTTTPNSLLSLYQASADTALTFGNSNVTMWTMGTDISDGSKFKIASSSALGTSDRLTIDTNGNVGIGTTTPASLFNIASTLPRFYLSDTDFATNGHWFMENDAGVFSLGTTSSALAVSGTRALSITNAGNVGIGTTTPGYKLTVNSTDGTSNLFQVSTTTNQGIMVITNAGNVGIGTTGPNTNLSVYNANESTTLTNFTQALTNAGIEIQTDYTNNAYTPGIFWSTINNNATKPKAGIWIQETGEGSYLNLGTSNNYPTGITNQALVVDPSGNVGIGTTSPGALFSVQGNGLFSGNIQVSGINATSTLTVQSTSATSTFSTGGLTVGTSQFVVQQTSGNVGIGTTNPGGTLDVNGDIYVKGIKFASYVSECGCWTLGPAAPTAFDIRMSTAGGQLITYLTGVQTVVRGNDWPNTNIGLNASGVTYKANGESGVAIDGHAFTVNTALAIAGSNIATFDNGGGDLVVIDKDGNVGIGTTSPAAKLSVVGRSLVGSAASAAIGQAADGLDVVVGSGTIGFQVWDDNALTVPKFIVQRTGNVGIGTTTPYARLSVVSGVTDNSDVIAVSTSTSGAIFRVTGYGNVVADGTITGGGADYAEYFYSQYTNLMPGETVCIDLLEKNAVKRCYRGHDNNVMGIVSTKPSILGNSTAAVKNDPEHYVIIGMLGQVDAFVSAENGPINIGDSLTSASSTPGYAMRADSGDSTVGVALEPLAAGKGKIKVLISRRNKSLAVEEVEALVVERIANMKIEDQVQAMIKQAVDNLNLDPKIQAIAQQEANKLDAALTVRLDDVDGKIFNFQFSIGNEFSKINDQMNALASGLYITNSQGQVIFSGNREIGALPNREVALTADSILLNGNVGIGTTSPWSMLSVNGTITQTNQKSCSAGLTTDANGAINGCVASDVSLKIDIASSTYDALSIIAQLAPVNYKWRNSLIKDSLIHSGFIAQEVAAVFPTAVLNAGLDENGKMMLGVDPNAMASLLVKGLQELNNSVMALSSGLYITDSQGQAIFPNNLDIASTAKNIILNGNVGIGVSSPKFKLDVAGNINSTGLCLNGVCKTSWDQLSANFSDSNLQANSGSGALTQNFALDENGYLALGKIKASELKTQKLTMDNNTGEPAIGNGVIKLNATSTVVINKNIEAGSKIFITWRENLNGADFWICSQISKESFSVCLDRAAATSTPFDYWIVGVDENKNPPNPLYQGGIGETPPSQALSETPVPVAEQITPPALETSVSNTPAEIAPAEIQPPLPPLSGGSESAPAETAPQETPAPEAATITEQVAPALPPTVSPEAVPAPEASPVPAVDTTTGN